jgi:hypothetical protein
MKACKEAKLLTLCLLFVVSAVAAISSGQENLLTNGGFEEDPATPLTWNMYGAGWMEVVSELIGADVPEGPIERNYCLHVVVPAAGTNDWDTGLKNIGHVFEAGKKYTLSAFLKCRQGTLQIRFNPELARNPWTAYGQQVFTMTEEWAEYSVTTPVFVSTVDPAELTFHAAFAPGEFWMDAVRFYEGDYVPPDLGPTPKARNPNPWDGSSDVPTDVVLSWTPGVYAATHDVYLGTVFDDVDAARRTDRRGVLVSQDQMANTYAPTLEYGQTYYWRIDEVSEPPDSTMFVGKVWTFTTKGQGEGSILFEYFWGTDGTVQSLLNLATFPNGPDQSELRTSLEGPTNWRDYYGTRVRGYLYPPATGDYTFWIASDDQSQLWLSTDENPANAVQIAGVEGWVPPRDFDNTGGGVGGPGQKSGAITLENGRRYYIEVLYSEGWGGDNLAVAWQGPSISTRAVISGTFLSPYVIPTSPVGTPISSSHICAMASSCVSDQGPDKTIDGSGLNASDQHGTTKTTMWLSSDTAQPPTWIQYSFDRAYELDQMWVWNYNAPLEPVEGFGVKEAKVEYSADGMTYTTLGVFQLAQAPGTPDYAHNTEVDFGGAVAKYVKITCNRNWGSSQQYGLSEVRFFIPAGATEDADGIPSAVEDNAPNGGDGNGDGTLDSQQDNVASLPNAADGQYVTLVSPDGMYLEGVSAIPNPSPGDAPHRVKFPVGFFEFTVSGLEEGAGTTVEILLPEGVKIKTYYKYGPTLDNPTHHWYEFLWDDASQTGAEILSNKVILHFVDGSRGDDDLTANGSIVEPGAPALVENQPPVAAITGPSSGFTVSVGTPVTLSGRFDDSDAGDTHTAQWTLSAGGSTEPIVVEGVVHEDNTVGGEITFAQAGIYYVTLTVTDFAGASGTATTVDQLPAFIVVYDPEGGFVTGGGWIWSPAGAYTVDATLEGKATFGFNAKYKKGATVPTGQTEFVFHAGSLNFHATSYDWLVVTGSKSANFKGIGTIDGWPGSYKFKLWAGDDVKDTFRIKIWSGDEQKPIYDNGSDQTIGGGSIVIHTN